MSTMNSESSHLLKETNGSKNYTNDRESQTITKTTTKKSGHWKTTALVVGVLLACVFLISYVNNGGINGLNDLKNDNVNNKDSSSLSTKRKAKRKSKTNNDLTSTPNILFILMDDMGYGDMSSRGAEFSTPNLDELYDNSILLNSHYIGLVCSPSRSQFITGRYAFNMGISEFIAFSSVELNTFPAALPTIGDLFARYTSYNRYYAGKWHLGHVTDDHLPLQRGFEKFYGFYTTNVDYNDKYIDNSDYYDTDYIDWRAMDEVDYDTQYTYSTYVTGDYVEDMINDHVSSDTTKNNPFLMMVPFEAVHPPISSITSDNSAQCDSLSDSQRRKMCESVVAVDSTVGEIVTNIKENNLWDDTIIIFTSDNGGSTSYGSCNYPLRGGKEKYFEGGIKTFAFLSGGYIESIKSNNDESDESQAIRKSLFHSTDWVPSLLSIAGADLSDIKQDLQDNLYIPIAKQVANDVDGNDDNYLDYLMDYSFDGIDQSSMILYGDNSDSVSDEEIETRNTLPLSINALSEKGGNLGHDIGVVFTSQYTGNTYKLFKLTDTIGPKTRNTELCMYGKDDGEEAEEDTDEDEESLKRMEDEMSQVYDDITDDMVDESDESDVMEIDEIKDKIDEMDSEDNEKRYTFYSNFERTDMFLFDLTLEPNELTNLVEYYLTDWETVDVSDDDEEGYKGLEISDVNSVYDENLVSLIWNEGMTKITDYMDNSVMASDYLKCQGADISEDGDPGKRDDNAYGSFYTWDEYVDKFEDQCSSKMQDNLVLKQMFQTRFNDWVGDNQ